MEYKKNYKKFSLAFKKEVAMEAIANKWKFEEEKPDDVWNPIFCIESCIEVRGWKLNGWVDHHG